MPEITAADRKQPTLTPWEEYGNREGRPIGQTCRVANKTLFVRYAKGRMDIAASCSIIGSGQGAEKEGDMSINDAKRWAERVAVAMSDV